MQRKPSRIILTEKGFPNYSIGADGKIRDIRDDRILTSEGSPFLAKLVPKEGNRVFTAQRLWREYYLNFIIQISEEHKRSLSFMGYDDYIIVSDGKIWNIIEYKFNQPIIRRGYFDYTICKNGEKKIIRAHRLVALAFIPNPENKPEVNHKDGVKTNCNVFNF